MQMKNQRIVVLGGTRGIGLAVAEQAAQEGASVAVVSSQPPSVAAALARLPKGATGEAVDLRSAEAVRGYFAKTGPFDHLVYTAGEELLLAPIADLDLAAARQFFELRYFGALTAVQAARPYLRAGGSIVLTGGTAGQRPPRGFAVGASLCGAIEALTRSLSVELAPLRVNVVVPGLVDTGLWANVPPDARAQMFREAGAKLPVGRIGTAADLAGHYLAFMRGGYVTGQSLVVDGGGVLV
jgi:NAD(P)-dependent dehydrogenase (short-subunit alcohol dehydrogenase family)